MKTYALVLVLAFVLLFAAMAGVAYAQTNASGGAGLEFGQHHAEHARDGMLSGDMNPGMHRGFAGWHVHHSH